MGAIPGHWKSLEILSGSFTLGPTMNIQVEHDPIACSGNDRFGGTHFLLPQLLEEDYTAYLIDLAEDISSTLDSTQWVGSLWTLMCQGCWCQSCQSCQSCRPQWPPEMSSLDPCCFSIEWHFSLIETILSFSGGDFKEDLDDWPSSILKVFFGFVGLERQIFPWF